MGLEGTAWADSAPDCPPFLPPPHLPAQIADSLGLEAPKGLSRPDLISALAKSFGDYTYVPRARSSSPGKKTPTK